MRYEWLMTTDAAEAIDCHPATLANWRYQKRGPPHERRLHHGHIRIVYRKDRLLAWARKFGLLDPTPEEAAEPPRHTPFDHPKRRATD